MLVLVALSSDGRASAPCVADLTASTLAKRLLRAASAAETASRGVAMPLAAAFCRAPRVPMPSVVWETPAGW